MAYTVKQIARLSGASVRTLHHYDEMDLLRPAYIGENNYRYYGEDELLQLQQILFYRELGIPLLEIKAILQSSAFDKIAALKSHRKVLEERAANLATLLNTVDKTLHFLQGGSEMKKADLFKGFDMKKQEKYERELVDRYGDDVKPHIAESHKRTAQWQPRDFASVAAQYDQISKKLTALLRQSAKPSDKKVQKLIAEHFQVVNRFYTPTKESYRGLGDMYVDHPEFKKLYDAHHPELAVFYREAMGYYAEENL